MSRNRASSHAFTSSRRSDDGGRTRLSMKHRHVVRRHSSGPCPRSANSAPRSCRYCVKRVQKTTSCPHADARRQPSIRGSASYSHEFPCVFLHSVPIRSPRLAAGPPRRDVLPTLFGVIGAPSAGLNSVRPTHPRGDPREHELETSSDRLPISICQIAFVIPCRSDCSDHRRDLVSTTRSAPSDS